MARISSIERSQIQIRARWHGAIAAVRALAAPLTSRELEVFEWARDDILRARLPNGPDWMKLTQKRPHMTFSGWRLAHAVLKAEFASPSHPRLQNLGFLWESAGYIDWRHRNLRLLGGEGEEGRDFTPSSYAGRLAQGLSILFGEDQNFHFKALIAQLPEARPYLRGGRQAKAADFVFENPQGQRMVLESKGSFSIPENDPTAVKSILRGALRYQVDPWLNRLRPAATKGFAVLSCIRKADLATPSALIYVDPPAEDTGKDGIPVPPSWVRRQNYATWLNAMGLHGPARRLRDGGEYSLEAYPFRVVDYRSLRLAIPDDWYTMAPFWRAQPAIEMGALKAISAALRGDDTALLAYGTYGTERTADTAYTPENGSLMGDGTYFGEIEPFKREDRIKVEL